MPALRINRFDATLPKPVSYCYAAPRLCCARPRQEVLVYLPAVKHCRYTNTNITGHALHDKGLNKRLGVGTLVNSQLRRALAGLVIHGG